MMTSTDIDENLREQSKQLLRKLKEKQGKLQHNVLPPSSDQPASETFVKQYVEDDGNSGPCIENNVREDLDSSLRKSGSQPSKNVRNRLHQRTRSKEDKENFNVRKHKLNEKNYPMTTENTCLKETFQEDKQNELESLREAVSKELQQGNIQNIVDKGEKSKDIEENLNTVETPGTVRRRKIIDKNVKVDAPNYLDLNASALIRECEDDMPKLNYSYSNIEDTDLNFLHERLGQNAENVVENELVKDCGLEAPQKYSENLENPGNNRKYAKFIRDVKKPKSILLSTSQRSNKSSTGNSSRVSFRSPTRDSFSNSYQMDSMSRHNHKMMGYDWIAALLDNDPQAVNQSETFFEELKEFRNVNLDECVNNMYMEGPMELWEHPEREPSPVQKALEETRTIRWCRLRSDGINMQFDLCLYLLSEQENYWLSKTTFKTNLACKVKPYMVNERLFAEPIKRSLFARYDYEEPDQNAEKQKEGTYEEPRFVRVSIPRSTLLAPHQVKPHRRNSFDAADTMALSRHCLKGWNTSQPSMMPAASNIGLRDSTMGIKSSLKTTLHEAETLAANYPYEWNAEDQSISRPVIKPMYRPECNYMNGSWPYNIRDSTNPSYTEASANLQRATDDLLNSTYSLMYEMKRLKNERSDHPLRV